MKVFTEKEKSPESWKGDVCQDTDKDGDAKSLNSDESSSPGEAASPPSSEEINPSLPEETVMAPLRQLPYQTILILLRRHPHHPSWIVDL